MKGGEIIMSSYPKYQTSKHNLLRDPFKKEKRDKYGFGGYFKGRSYSFDMTDNNNEDGYGWGWGKE